MRDAGLLATGGLADTADMELTPFDPAAAAIVSSWARSEEEVLAWCSRTDVPVAAAVIASWADAPDVTAYALHDDDQMIGYGEVWNDDEEAEVELARLIIEPGHRGRGYGRWMVAELVRLALPQQPLVVMRVHPDNPAAMRCYAGAGFAPVAASEQARWNDGQPIAYTWMTYVGL